MAGEEKTEDPRQHWDARYSEREQLWSGNPNVALVATVGSLAPGRALDLGCGEGADSVWLAERGWQVTAVDVSATAIERAEGLAASHGIPGERITWVLADVASWEPAGPYDLVSACFLHSLLDFPREEVLRRAAGAVGPGGRVLVVGHAEPPPWTADHADHGGPDHGGPDHGGHEHRVLTPEGELAGLQLDPGEWSVEVSEVRTRAATGPDGQQAMLRDVVTFVRRRP